jgi:hypothetical protein
MLLYLQKDKWMRPIMNRSDDYRDRRLREIEYDPTSSQRVSLSKREEVNTG